ncbi:PAS domain S-box protein [Candidatus Saccharibacteria bacterium]|nr:PAS domain S-box protein [Candidatus Saccharibacteria bacterium]
MPEDTPPSTQSADLERERLTSLINSMGDGVIAIDEQTNVALYNGAALNILDINASMAGKAISEVLKLEDKNNQPIDIKRIILDTKTSTASREWRLQYPDGELVNLYISIAPVRLGYGKEGMRGYVILLRDITREKSLEEERDEFISVVSHELRTPIAISEGNVSNAMFLVNKNGDLSAVRHALEQTYDQIVFLSGMINDLATLSRAERGKLTVDIESINVRELVDELVTSYLPDAQKKGLGLKAYLDPTLEVLLSSRLYVKEILQNFITNGIKYTEHGQVIIGAQTKLGGVLFYVNDTGIGISKTDQEKVFDKFFRSEDYRTRQNSGTGLGLYVTMKLARLVHAEISLDSELDKGSTFSIFIPNLR